METKKTQRTAIFPDKERIIYHNTFHKFSFLDRFRILFGCELSVHSKIETIFNASVTGNSEAKTHVSRFYVERNWLQRLFYPKDFATLSGTIIHEKLVAEYKSKHH